MFVREVEERTKTTYYGWLFAGWRMDGRDVLRIAHGEECIDCAVLISAHGIDDGVPYRKSNRKNAFVAAIMHNVC